MNERFLMAVIVMAFVTFSCRFLGYLIGILFGDRPRLRRLLEILPTCAIAAVIGPAMATITLVESIALTSAAAVFLLSSRFLLSLSLGAAVLGVGGYWLDIASS